MFTNNGIMYAVRAEGPFDLAVNGPSVAMCLFDHSHIAG
jgi:hypothetical protein